MFAFTGRLLARSRNQARGSRVLQRARRHVLIAGALVRSTRTRRVSLLFRYLGAPVRPLPGECFGEHLFVIKQGVSHRPGCHARQGAGWRVGVWRERRR